MIKAENLYFSYTGTPPFVLNGINLQIDKGEYVSVVGENGCGKSTLMRLILRFLKPTNGTIITKSKKIGYVPQKTESISSGFPLTVFEMLNSYRKLLKIKDKSIVAESLRQVGIYELKDSLIGNLSGGQSQKALIARALIGSPELIILDEPSAGIDVDSQIEIYSLLKKLNTENDITIISVEHNLNAAVANSTLIYHLFQGEGQMFIPKHYAEEYLNSKGKDNLNA